MKDCIAKEAEFVIPDYTTMDAQTLWRELQSMHRYLRRIYRLTREPTSEELTSISLNRPIMVHHDMEDARTEWATRRIRAASVTGPWQPPRFTITFFTSAMWKAKWARRQSISGRVKKETSEMEA